MTKDIFKDIANSLAPQPVLEHFGVDYRQEGRRYLICCPCPDHNDKNPSCSVDMSPPGGCKCHSCDETGDVLTLWQHLAGGGPLSGHLERLCEVAGLEYANYGRGPKERLTSKGMSRKLDASYRYVDEAGREVWTIHRYIVDSGRKKFVQVMPSGSKRAPPKEKQVLYNLPALKRAIEEHEPIFLVEGEKCVDAMTRVGLVATTWAGGSNSVGVLKHIGGPLGDTDVICLPDNDKAGEKAMQEAAFVLKDVNARLVRCELPGLKHKGDVADFIAAGGTREQILEAAETYEDIDNGEWTQLLDYKPSGDLRDSEHNAFVILRHHPACKGVLRKNLLLQSVEVAKRPPWDKKANLPYPAPLKDEDAMRIGSWLANLKGMPLKINSKALWPPIMTVASDQAVDPVRDYLTSLEWDGKQRLDCWAKTYLGTPRGRVTDDPKDMDPWVYQVAACRWMIAAVKRALDPGCKVDTVLVLEGEQGRGKSTALAVLGGQWFTDQLQDITSKDAKQLIGQSWIVEVAELDAFERREMTAVKSFLTARIDKFRAPYDRVTLEHPRRCIIAATTNATEYLRDPTGSRRFWPLPVEHVDLGALRRDRDQLWAEAVHRANKGEAYHISEIGLEASYRRLKSSRIELDPWHELVADWVDGRDRVTIAQILTEAIRKESDRWTLVDRRRVGKILSYLDWKNIGTRRVDGGRAKVYAKPSETQGKSGNPGISVAASVAASVANKGKRSR